MERIQKLRKLQAIFHEEKKFNGDGYYRLRKIDDFTLEIAFLVAGPCGETIVHPQITVSLTHSKAIGTKLIDLETTPPTILHRTASTSHEIDVALDNLIEKFLSIK